MKEWRDAYLVSASTEMTKLCKRRAEHLLYELQHMGFTSRPAAVQAACEALHAGDAGGLSETVFKLWHARQP